MKLRYTLALTLCIFLIPGFPAMGQSGFSPDTYMQFLQESRDLSAEALLQSYPPQYTYYSYREYPTGLSSIPWFDSLDQRYSFTMEEKQMLQRNHFMVTERLASYDWASAFIGLYSADMPLFLSTDFILSTLHNSYDAILQTLEWQFLEPNLKELLHALYGQFPQLAESYGGDQRFVKVLEDVDLYVSVALSLSEGATYAPQYGSIETFEEVMEAVESEQMTYMPLFTDGRNRKLDFSQFTPRGHYNRAFYTPDGIATLEDYFRAMMWLGRIDFLMTAPPQNPWESNWTDEELRRMQLGALLLNQLLYGSGMRDNLEKHEQIITFLVGPDDNLTSGELQSLFEQTLEDPTDLFDPEQFGSFKDRLNASDDYGQKIMSNFFFVDPFSSDPGKLPVSFKLLGQKFLIDSYVFSEVVFDRIIFEGKKIWRPLPDPLDAMAALGNEDALALLENELSEYKYSAKMAGLKYLIEAYDEEFWEQSLYNTWLGAIRSLNPPVSATGLPFFMKTTGWHHQKLNTQLTSWAQLRHDNILYGKQSYTGGTGCSYPYTYVEPCPEFYNRLKEFAGNAAGFFREVLDGIPLAAGERIIAYYDRYEELMAKLESVANKELEGRTLNETEITFLKTMIHGYMASGPSVSGWYNDLFFDPAKGLTWDFTVADVHTQPTELNGAVVGKVLHVGNGKIDMGVVLAENPCNPGQLMAFAGPVSAFHQHVTAGFERLTDQDWEDRFRGAEETVPERPDWVAAYLLDGEGKEYPRGRALKGIPYLGTGFPKQELNPFDYLLLFPNPAIIKSHLRLMLNQETEFRMEIFDASGRKVHAPAPRILAPAEHQIEFSVEGWPAGIYLARIILDGETEVRELVVH